MDLGYTKWQISEIIHIASGETDYFVGRTHPNLVICRENYAKFLREMNQET